LALQSIDGSLCPTPRGSIAMMSKRSLSAGNGSAPARLERVRRGAAGAAEVDEQRADLLPVAGDLATKSLMLWPFGWS
jgi:hypothetical protein